MILGIAAFASCATIVRLRYLSLYSDPTELMFSTGKIGLWSLIEEGMGIFAGSLPALRPLLSRSFFNGTSSGNSNSASAGNKYNQPWTGKYHGSKEVQLDTFHQLAGEKDSDRDSQKHILKETRVTMTNEPSGLSSEWERS